MSETSSRRVWGQRPGQPFLTADYECGGILQCTRTRRWFAKIAALSSYSLPVNRLSTQRRASRMNPPAARAAAMHARRAATMQAVSAKCLRLYAQSAASPPAYRSSRSLIVRSIAASATQPSVSNHSVDQNNSFRNRRSYFLPLYGGKVLCLTAFTRFFGQKYGLMPIDGIFK